MLDPPDSPSISTGVPQTRGIVHLIVLVLVAGCVLRISAFLPAIDVDATPGGDPAEYFMVGVDFAYFLTTGESAGTGVDRTLGLPILLSPMFLLHSGSEIMDKEATVPVEMMRLQKGFTTLLSCAVLIATSFLAYRQFGAIPSLVATCLIAFSGPLIAAAPAGLTEELFSLLILSALILVSRHHQGEPSLASFALLGIILGWLVLTKTEGFLLLPPLVLAMMWGSNPLEASSWKRAGLLLLPSVLAFAGHKYYVDLVGAIPIEYRGGNYLFISEFLSGRMPWGYMRDLRIESFRISYTDWLVDYHTLRDVPGMIFGSLVAILRFTSQALNWPALCLTAVGLVILLRQRQWLIPAIVVFALSPYVLLLGFYPEGRYIHPQLPLLALGAAVGYGALEQRVPWVLTNHSRRLAIALLMGLAPVLAPSAATATTALSAASSQCREGVVALRQGRVESARKAFTGSVTVNPVFAPAHFGLASVSHVSGDQEAAREHLRDILEITPYFAEASFMLGDLVFDEDPGAARDYLDGCVDHRPDFSPCHFLRAKLDMTQGRFAEALAGYQQYMKLNRLTHGIERASCNVNGRWSNPCELEMVAELDEILDSRNPLRSGSLSERAWQYLHKATGEYGTYAWKPNDTQLGMYVGICNEELGDLPTALNYYQWQLDLEPDNDRLVAHLNSLRGPKTR